MPSSLLERRPDIRAAEQSLMSANAQIGVARAAMLPVGDPHGLLSAGKAPRSKTSLAAAYGDWGLACLALRCSTPGGERRSRTKPGARYQQTVAQWQRSVEGAFREVADALVNVEEIGASEADLLARVQAARNALELSRIRYESGYSPYLEVLDAQRTANDAEIAFVRNRQARLAFTVDLMRALGGGWQPN